VALFFHSTLFIEKLVHTFFLLKWLVVEAWTNLQNEKKFNREKELYFIGRGRLNFLVLGYNRFSFDGYRYIEKICVLALFALLAV